MRPRLLFLTHRLPYAPNRGDRIRAFHLLRALTRLADVQVVALTHDAAEDSHARDLSSTVDAIWTARVPHTRNRLRAAMALAGSTPLTHVLLDSPRLAETIERAVSRARPDVIYAYCSGIAPVALAPPLDTIPLIADLVDVDSQKWRDLAADASTWRAAIYRREATTLAAFEVRLASRARSTFVVSERERDVFPDRQLAQGLSVIPNGIDVAHFAPSADSHRRSNSVVFTGVFDYAPNETGARWLIESVWPEVRRRVPSATLTLAGASPTTRLRNAAAGDSSIELTGAVPDIRPYLWRATVAAAPVFVSRGVQNKVLEALAAGLPCATTSAVLDGLPVVARAGCLAADEAAPFADALVTLLEDSDADRQRRVDAAEISSLGWDRMLGSLAGHVECAAAAQSATHR